MDMACFEADKKVLNLMVQMAAEFCEHANWEFLWHVN